MTLNRRGRRYDIDTILREEAGEAFAALARDLGVDDEQGSRWFDDWRAF